MADGLLTSGLNWIDQQKQALKARFGLLADNPEEFARQLAAETQQRMGKGLLGEPKTAEEMASGKWINTPYGKQAIQAFSIAAPIAYHGSPYIFDKFDLSKVGTGEGAQAYGHGSYFAESPEVARGYQMALSGKAGQETTIGGKPIVDLYNKIYDKANKLPFKQAQLEYDKAAMLEKMMLDTPPSELVKYAKDIGSDPKVIQWLEKEIAPKTKVPGAFYKVDIPDTAAKTFLDWDKPLNQQPVEIQNALKNTAIPKDFTGSQIYDWVSKVAGAENKNKSAAASRWLNEQGIQGIKYLDQGSRMTNEGTRNFVVFDPNIVKILERNNQPVQGLLK